MYQTEKEIKQRMREELILIVIVMFTLLLIGTIVYHLSEGWTYLDSLYFATISLTARGFSNLYPSNWFSVLFSVFYLIIGVSVVIYAISSMIGFYNSFYQEKIRKMVKNIKRKAPERWLRIKHK